MNELGSQRELERVNKMLVVEHERKEKEANERRLAEAQRKENAYKSREEIRGWVTAAIAFLALALSLFSVIWQAQLH